MVGVTVIALFAFGFILVLCKQRPKTRKEILDSINKEMENGRKK